MQLRISHLVVLLERRDRLPSEVVWQLHMCRGLLLPLWVPTTEFAIQGEDDANPSEKIEKLLGKKFIKLINVISYHDGFCLLGSW